MENHKFEITKNGNGYRVTVSGSIFNHSIEGFPTRPEITKELIIQLFRNKYPEFKMRRWVGKSLLEAQNDLEKLESEYYMNCGFERSFFDACSPEIYELHCFIDFCRSNPELKNLKIPYVDDYFNIYNQYDGVFTD